MPNLDLAGQLSLELAHRYLITATNFSVKVTIPTVVKKGAFGPIGMSQGVPDVTGSFKIAIPKSGPEISLSLNDVTSLFAKPSGTTISYTLGPVGTGKKYLILGARASEKDISVDQGAGNLDVTINFTATEEIPA